MNNEVRIFKNTSELTYDDLGTLLKELGIKLSTSSLKNKARSDSTQFLNNKDLRTLMVGINDPSHAHHDVIKKLQNTHKFCTHALSILDDNVDVDSMDLDFEDEFGEDTEPEKVLEESIQKSDEAPVTNIGKETEIDFDEDFEDEDFEDEDFEDEDFDKESKDVKDEDSDKNLDDEVDEDLDDEFDEFDEDFEDEELDDEFDEAEDFDEDFDKDFDEEDKDDLDDLISDTTEEDDVFDEEDDDFDLDDFLDDGEETFDEMPAVKNALATADDFESMADDEDEFDSQNFEF